VHFFIVEHEKRDSLRCALQCPMHLLRHECSVLSSIKSDVVRQQNAEKEMKFFITTLETLPRLALHFQTQVRAVLHYST
jgi:hypothetical protein